MNSRNPMNLLIFALICLLAFCSSLFAAEAAIPSPKTRIALLPFENLTDDKTAFVQIMPVVKNRLETRGFELVDEDSLNKFLLKERVRSTGYIAGDLAQKMERELNVKAVMVGSITSYYPIKNPQVGILARLIDSSSGEILWANQASATGEDFTKMLGLGTIRSMEDLVLVVVDRLLISFSIASSRKEKELTHRIAVMPFQNKSRHKDAGTIVTYMFLVSLLKQDGFEPVEYGEIRRLIVDLRVRYKGELDYKSIKDLSESLNVDGILVGTVEIYSDGLDTSSPPEVAVSARLINARKSRILWSDGVQVKGDQDVIALDWGRIRAVDSVSYKAVTKLIQKMEKAKWQ